MGSTYINFLIRKNNIKNKLDGTARIRTAVQESQTLEDRPGYPTVPKVHYPKTASLSYQKRLKAFCCPNLDSGVWAVAIDLFHKISS